MADEQKPDVNPENLTGGSGWESMFTDEEWEEVIAAVPVHTTAAATVRLEFTSTWLAREGQTEAELEVEVARLMTEYLTSPKSVLFFDYGRHGSDESEGPGPFIIKARVELLPGWVVEQGE